MKKKKCSKCGHAMMHKAVKEAKEHSMKKQHAKLKRKDKVEKVMKEFKEDKLHSGSKKGPKVHNRKQAIAIALSESRKEGAKKKKK